MIMISIEQQLIEGSWKLEAGNKAKFGQKINNNF